MLSNSRFYLFTLSCASTLLFSLLFFSTNHVFAANITVCSSGCQYTTIQSAVTAAQTGDVIKVGPGTYAGDVTINKRVTIESEDFYENNQKLNATKINGVIVINGGTWAWDQGPIIRGLYFSGHTKPIVGEAPFTAEYNYITGDSDGISFEPGAGGIARGNYIENTSDDCIDVDHQELNILIEDNKMINCGQDGIEVRQQNANIASRATLTFRRNVVDGSGEDAFQIMDYNNFTNRLYIIQGNLLMNSGKAGIGIMPADNTNQNYGAAAMPEPLYAINNTFVNNDAGISGGANLIALNNIFSGQITFDLKNVNGRSVIKHSVFATTAKQQGTNNLDAATTRTGNPMLDTNYGLQTGSNAIDAGLASYSHSYTREGQTFNDTVLALTATQYGGSAPDAGWKESSFTGGPTTAPTSGPTSGPTTQPTARPSAIPTPTRFPGTITPTSPGCKLGDIDCSGKVNAVDVSLFLQDFGSTQDRSDLDNSGKVNATDLSILLQKFGT